MLKIEISVVNYAIHHIYNNIIFLLILFWHEISFPEDSLENSTLLNKFINENLKSL